ncbi:DinB family protein [Salegentibacter sp. F14]
MESSQFRKQLVDHLLGGGAFLPIDEQIDRVPFESLGVRPAGLPYSFYELFFHIRIAQKDIMDFCMAGSYQTPKWPEAYWPDSPAPKSSHAWEALKSDYLKERQEFIRFIEDQTNALLLPVKHAEDQILLHEVMLVITHTAYHLGQLVIISRLLGVYSAKNP